MGVPSTSQLVLVNAQAIFYLGSREPREESGQLSRIDGIASKIKYCGARSCAGVEIHPRRGLSEMRSEPVRDVVDSEGADSPDAADLVLHYAMERIKIGRRCKTLCYRLESGLRLFEQGSWDATLMRMPFSARQRAYCGFSYCCGRTALDLKEAHLGAGTVTVMSDVMTHNLVERHGQICAEAAFFLLSSRLAIDDGKINFGFRPVEITRVKIYHQR